MQKQPQKKKVVLIEVHIFRDKKQIERFLAVVDPDKAIRYKMKLYNSYRDDVVSNHVRFEISSYEKEEIIEDLKIACHDKKINLFDVTGFEKKSIV